MQFYSQIRLRICLSRFRGGETKESDTPGLWKGRQRRVMGTPPPIFPQHRAEGIYRNIPVPELGLPIKLPIYRPKAAAILRFILTEYGLISSHVNSIRHGF